MLLPGVESSEQKLFANFLILKTFFPKIIEYQLLVVTNPLQLLILFSVIVNFVCKGASTIRFRHA